MRGGRLPDLRALARHISDMRVGARLRGVEATVVGHLVARGDELLLTVAGTGEVVRLASLRRKVQWDVPAKREEPATDEERTAFRRLLWQSRRARRRSPLFRVVGPLIEGAAGKPMTLEVRQFSALAPDEK
jgi:hypothetical protein